MEMGETAIVEPVESSEPVESVDSGAETSTEASEGGSQGEPGHESTETQPKVTPKGKLDLASVVKTKAEALKSIDPALPAAIRTAAFELGSLYREFPGGLKEAVQVKNALGEIGGVEGIKEYTEALGDYQALESLFEKGDPQFMVRLAETLPQSFSQIMPAGLEKWKQSDPEMYNHVQSRVMVQTLDSAKFSDTIEQIWSRLDPEKQKGERDALAQLWQTIDGFRKSAEKAPERKTNPQDEALQKREQELAARETKALLAPVANEGRQQIQTITDREMNTGYRWADTDPEIKSAVQERVRQEVVKASSKDKTFTNEFERLKERSDGAGLSRHVRNFQERVTPGIVQRVAKLFAVRPKNAGPVAVKKPAVVANGNGKAEQGWAHVSQMPNPSQVDRRKTTDDMVLANRAILKDGRKVAWA